MREADNLPPYCAVVKKSRNLNFLDPSGPQMVCNGSALPYRIKVTLLEPTKTKLFVISYKHKAQDAQCTNLRGEGRITVVKLSMLIRRY